LRVSEGGNKLRIRFSNRYGAGPLAIGAARSSASTMRARRSKAARALSFGGTGEAVILRGAPCGDVVTLDVPSLSRLKVEFYLPKATGRAPTSRGWMNWRIAGQFVGKPFTPVSRRSSARSWRWWSGFTEALGTIVAFGVHRWRGRHGRRQPAAGPTSWPIGCRPRASAGQWPIRPSAAIAS
jgi:hypothetical protein